MDSTKGQDHETNRQCRAMETPLETRDDLLAQPHEEEHGEDDEGAGRDRQERRPRMNLQENLDLIAAELRTILEGITEINKAMERILEPTIRCSCGAEADDHQEGEFVCEECKINYDLREKA